MQVSIDENSALMKVVQIPAMEDNYFYLIICQKTQEAAFIDPCDTRASINMSEQFMVEPKWIINTHHHWDHIGANEELKRHFDCSICASKGDQERVPGCDRGLEEGDSIEIGELNGKVLATPGHTRHHISIYFEAAKALFCGDTLFSGGCGRLFEGTAEQMVDSLYNKILPLPDDTQVFCGHEYTEANLEFARTVEPDNHNLREYSKRVASLRHKDRASIPTTIGLEKKINPFLRCGTSKSIYETLVVHDKQLKYERLPIFIALRHLKNRF